MSNVLDFCQPGLNDRKIVHMSAASPFERLHRDPLSRMETAERLRSKRAWHLARVRELEAQLRALTGIDETIDDGGPDAA